MPLLFPGFQPTTQVRPLVAAFTARQKTSTQDAGQKAITPAACQKTSTQDARQKNSTQDARQNNKREACGPRRTL
jgi:hypothetical protein